MESVGESSTAPDDEAKKPERPAPRRSTRKKMNKPIVNDRVTPMGLPKPKRMDKAADVSIEDHYLQKDYRTPKTTSALPTIFDEVDTKRKQLVSKAKRKRHIDFETDPALRKKRKGAKRAQKRKFDETGESMDILKAKLAKLDADISQDKLNEN